MALAAGIDGVTVSVQTGSKSLSGYCRKPQVYINLRKVISSHPLPPPKKTPNGADFLLTALHNAESPAGLKL